MPRWVWFLPVAVLALAAGGLAFVLGARKATTTETEVIEHVASLWEAQGGARVDCRAIPASSEGLWLVVICEPETGPGREYFVDRFGRVDSWQALESGV
ncbi:MAG: hypothetical protein AAF066_12050 [Pseudomonadota bacterium]